MFPNPPRRSSDGASAASRRSRRADARLATIRLARSVRGDGGQTFAALSLNSVTSLVAGALLGATTDTFERIPGLIVLVPAAIGLRGNVYSAMGSRLSTAIHMGNFRLSLRRESLMGQNVRASVVLTMGLALFAAVLASAVALAFGISGDVQFSSLVIVSVVGGLIASVVVLAATIGLAAGSVRYSWDLDALVAPVVSTLGDVLTLPALWFVATRVLDTSNDGLSLTAIVVIVAAVGVTLWSLWAREEMLRSIMRESVIVLIVAVVLSTLAGLALEHQLTALTIAPALLVMVPAFVSSAGAVGGILASRCATLLHLGTVAPTLWPERPIRREVARLLAIALPIQVLNAAGAYLIARSLDGGEGSWIALLTVALVGGALAAGFVVFIAYGASIAAYRFGLDPDTYGIPVVTSSVDFIGVLLLLVTATAVGLI